MKDLSSVIVVEIKTTYGDKLVYPICEQGRLFAQLCSTKTLTPAAIKIIQQLGYEIKVAVPTLPD